MKSVYEQLEGVFKKAESFIDTFSKYQILWDIDQRSEKVLEILGDKVDKWTEFLNGVTESKWQMSELTTNHVFIGGLKISYGLIYDGVSKKFD